MWKNINLTWDVTISIEIFEKNGQTVTKLVWGATECRYCASNINQLVYQLPIYKFSPLSFFILVNTTYEWRLVDGSHDYEGTLQIRVENSSWKAFEGLLWGTKMSNVACRMFGYSMALSPFAIALEPETEPYSFYFAYFGCLGTENSLLKCTNTFTFRSVHNSSMYEPGELTRLFLRCLPSKCCTKTVSSPTILYNILYFTLAMSAIVRRRSVSSHVKISRLSVISFYDVFII